MGAMLAPLPGMSIAGLTKRLAPCRLTSSGSPANVGGMDALKTWMQASGVNQSELARRLNITHGAVSQWMTAGEIPLGRVKDLARVTGIPPQLLRPDVFGVAA